MGRQPSSWPESLEICRLVGCAAISLSFKDSYREHPETHMTQVKIENLHKLGQLLKDSAEAIKTLADSIAHIVRLGDSAWSEVSARRTRPRLKRLHQDLTAFAEVQGERRGEIQELVNRLSRDDVELPRITINWEEAMLEVGELALALEQILSDVRQERSTIPSFFYS
jgi:hypothetical protein